jgi:cardiolipin synthase
MEGAKLTEAAFTLEGIERTFGRGFSLATRVQLLWKGKDSFRTIFEAVAEAEQVICLQFYIFKNDGTGTELSDILKRRSREGVRVYLLYDHFGSIGTPGSFWKEMRDAGIQVRASRPFRWTAPLHYVHRDHRKLIVIDSEKAFTGGLNIANEYSGYHLRRRSRGWRDTGVLLEGPIVGELFETFRNSWRTWGGDEIDIPEKAEATRTPTGEIGPIPNSLSAAECCGNLPALPIFAYSGRGRRRMRNLFRFSAQQARASILLTTAYFIPSRKMTALLENAVRRGVRVRLLVPGRSDIPAASYAGRAFFGRLLKAGVEIFTYLGEMLHAKTYVFDQSWSVIGSTNLDYQSLFYNDEGNVGILDPEFGRKMTEIFEEDLKNSNRIDLEVWQRRPLIEKVRDSFFALFRKRL